MSDAYAFAKGHGTENDFVLLPDPDGSVHADLSAARVRALTDRHAGLGGDGVLRVVRTRDLDKLDQRESLDHRGEDLDRLDQRDDAEWFMDYRNADGSLSEMCGNGIRVFGRYLVEEGWADPSRPLPVATRDGVKTLTFDRAGDITVDMGTPTVLGETIVGVGGWEWSARHVDMGNPHAVAFVDDLADAGPLLEAPTHDPATYPDGVNVEFVVRRGAHHVAMRVHERGSGETRSCGTGACAVMVAAALEDEADRGTTYRVDLPGGTLRVAWTREDRVLMTGPAVIVGRGTTSL